MPSLSAAATQRAQALQRLCNVTGGQPFGGRAPDEATRMMYDASLFEMLANCFESIMGRLNKLELEKKEGETDGSSDSKEGAINESREG